MSEAVPAEALAIGDFVTARHGAATIHGTIVHLIGGTVGINVEGAIVQVGADRWTFEVTQAATRPDVIRTPGLYVQRTMAGDLARAAVWRLDPWGQWMRSGEHVPTDRVPHGDLVRLGVDGAE
jgi:hypothetical protein